MPYGIGAGGLLGVALEVLPPPVQSALATATTGGTLAAGTYRYYVTAVNASGETTISNEQSIVTTGATSTVTVTWVAVTGATQYKVYRTAAGGAAGTQLLLTTVTAPTVTYIDTGALTPSGAFPTANTAYDAGTYRAPTKFIPITSESLQMMEETVFRRPIRQTAGIVGAVAGNEHPEGDVEMEGLEDCLLYFLLAARLTVAKTGSAPNHIYTFTPNDRAVATRTLSVTVIRSEQVFGYTGITVGSFRFGIDNGMLTFGASVTGKNEASQPTPTPITWPTTAPFGAGQYNIEVPTGTTVTDTDTFEWTEEDNAEVQFRLKNTGRGSDFTSFGERDITLTMGRDFLTRADYDAYKAITAQSLTITATKGVNNSVAILMPVSIKDSYEVALGGQGDLLRASVSYKALINGSGVDATITIKTQEDVAV